MTHPHDQSLDFYRAALKATGDMIKISLESAERLRKQQLAAVSEALASHAQAIAEADAAKGFAELASATAKLAGIQYQMMTSYWNGIQQTSVESQAEITRQLKIHAEQLRHDLQKSLGKAPDGTVPILAALQPLVDMASSAHMLAARASAGMQHAANKAPRKSA